VKKKFSKVLGVGLTLVLMVSLLLAAAPVSASTLLWSTEVIPTTLNNILVTTGGLDVDDMAVAGDGYTIHVATGADDAMVYTSWDNGATFTYIGCDASAANVRRIAVAPDDANIIAVIADNAEVYITTDGGTIWGTLGTVSDDAGADASYLTDIDISTAYLGVHYIAVSGYEADGNGNVWYWNLGAAAPAWLETNDLNGFNTTSTSQAGTANMSATVAFSPNFASDLTLTTVIVDDAANEITFEVFSFASLLWNQAAGTFDDYPVTISDDTSISDITVASISLGPDYNSGDDTTRLAFVGLDVAGATAESGIYRLDDVTLTALRTGATTDVRSVAYNGSTLVAGRNGSNTTVWRSDDPLATTPTVLYASSLKRPGGASGVVVAWAGGNVVAGTSGQESAFAVSTDDGASFVDISLIDTTLAVLSDVAVSADGSTVYLATADASGTNGDLSLWRRVSTTWERVLSVLDADSDFLIRLAPEDADVVYLADQGGTAIYYSANGGLTRWQTRTCGANVQDMAVESADVAYALTSGGYVYKSANAGFTWGTALDTLLYTGNMILSLSTDNLIVGGTAGLVSYSTDGATTWALINTVITGSTQDVQVAATGLTADDYIYAVATVGGNIYRLLVGDATEYWEDITTSGGGLNAVTDNVTGMVLQDGILYALACGGTNSDFYRTLDPAASPTVWWSAVDVNGVTFGATTGAVITPKSLKVSSGSNKLWAIDYGNDALYSFTDTLATVGPELTAPADGFTIAINPITGRTTDITFAWNKPSDQVSEYNLYIYSDAAMSQLATAVYGDGNLATAVSQTQIVGPYQSSTAALDFLPGTTYYWAVEVSDDGPVYSPWSETRSFTIGEAAAPEPIVIPPAEVPDIIVEVPAPIIEIPPTPAPETPGYIWGIIIIGAVLVIALIVLIIRTRRVA